MKDDDLIKDKNTNVVGRPPSADSNEGVKPPATESVAVPSPSADQNGDVKPPATESVAVPSPSAYSNGGIKPPATESVAVPFTGTQNTGNNVPGLTTPHSKQNANPGYEDWRKDDKTLTNAGLPEEEREWFSDARPRVVKPAWDPMEKFFNWARANSLWFLAFGTGCGAIELRPLVTARYDVSRLGMAGRPTPRQSNVFLIGGYVSIKTLKRIVRSYEQMQGPKFVVAVCSCAINGGMYWDSYNTVKRIDQYIPVDVYITGCMPRPEAILEGFAKLKELIKAGKAEGQNLYAEKFDWYKENQKKVIHDWNMPDYNW